MRIRKPSAIKAAKSEAKAERNAQIVARIKAGERRCDLAREFRLLAKSVGDIAQRGGIAPGTRFTRE